MILADTSSERAIILAPRGRDAEIASKLLRDGGFRSCTVKDLHGLLVEIETGAGLAIVADEAIRNADIRSIVEWLKRQPAWSDFPFIALMSRGGGAEDNPAAIRLTTNLGNVSFLERPFHPTTLTSLVRTALRGRRRQYEARSRLEELTEGERRLQNALTAGNLGSWTLHVPTMKLEASQTCKKHFGCPPEKTFGYDELRSSIHPDDASRMQASVQRTLATGEDYVIEYRNVWDDGSVHWVDVRARALLDEGGIVEQLIGVSSDITARKNSEIDRERLLAELAEERLALSQLTATLERRVEQRTEELKTESAARERAQDQLLQSQKMEGLGQLTGGVAHDFNNLLSAVMGNLDLLKRRIPDDPRAQRYVDGALQGAKRGAALTQRMLSFARQQELKTESADLRALILGMRDLLDRSLGPRVEMSLHLPAGLPPAKVDSNQVELAVLNLAVNARDAMPDGGRIRISAGFNGDRQLFLKVEDTGTGMDEATLKKAVEPFFSTKPVGKGTGLGLSMVHGLAVQLGGRFELASELGRGTTATLWLPVADMQTVATLQQQGEEVEASGVHATILVVDDDPLIAASAVDMLEDLGHKVIEASSAERALEILKVCDQKIDLLMTDQAMPGMTGIELARQVRMMWPDLPILLATGYADLNENGELSIPRLSKPYLQTDLRKQIDKLLI
jgi:PAS domain S-box-containing protein